jgi:hypothetical protein
MEENTDPNKPSGEPPTPDVAAMLRALEREAAARRERRGAVSSPFQTGAFRYGILIAIVVFAFAALGVLEWMLSQIPRPAHPSGTPAPAMASPGGSAGDGAGTGK